jgi:hypothetical protein
LISEIDGLLSFENRKNLYIVSNGEFYCLNNRGIFYSKDSGASWIRLNIQWPEEYNLQHPWTITIKEYFLNLYLIDAAGFRNYKTH